MKNSGLTPISSYAIRAEDERQQLAPLTKPCHLTFFSQTIHQELTSSQNGEITMQPSIKSTTEQGDQSRPLSHTHKISKIHQKAKPLENKPISHNPIKKFSHYSHIFKNKPTQHEIKEFMATWSRLTPDKYLNNPKNRSRKVAKFTYSALDRIITPIKDTTFYKAKKLTKSWEGLIESTKKAKRHLSNPPLQKIF